MGWRAMFQISNLTRPMCQLGGTGHRKYYLDRNGIHVRLIWAFGAVVETANFVPLFLVLMN